jgi:hypothetical protein
MQSKFSPARILRTIDEQELGYTLEAFAAEFAVLGYLDITRELISLVNKLAPLYRRNAHAFKPLWLIWDITGTWPEGEEAYIQQSADSGDQGRNERRREAVAKLAEQYETSDWENAGFKKKREQLYDETRLGSCVEKLKELTGQGKEWLTDATTGGVAMTKGSILVKALEIAIVLKAQGSSHAGQGLPEADEIMGWIAKGLHGNQMINYLTQSTKAWGLLKDGTLAKAIGVKDEKVQELGGKVIDAFKTRYGKGVQRNELWNKSMEELVQIISHNTVNNQAAKSYRVEMYRPEEESEEGDEGKHLTTILETPLSRADIADLEKRLDISLPDDYKDFLATTDGMGASWGGIIPKPPLFPASEVRWITKEDYFTDLDADIFPGIFGLTKEIYGDEQWPMVGMPLQIGSEDIDEVWLLPPLKVKEIVAMYLTVRERSAEAKTIIENIITSWAGSVGEFAHLEWCVMTWASGGAADMRAYPSFRAFMVNKAQDSSDDRGMELPEQVCFSYSCR